MALTLIALVILGLSAALPALAHGLRIAPLRAASATMARSYRAIVDGAFRVATMSGLLIALIQLFTLITRNMFGVNFIAVQESLLYLFGALFLLGAAGVYLLDGHVRVDVLYSQWSDRRRRVVDVAGTYVFLLPVCALILIASTPYVAQSWATMERSAEPSGIHAVFLLKSLIPAFAVLMAMAAIVRLEELMGRPADA